MAKQPYNLSAGVEDGFDFVLADPKSGDDIKFHVKYPSAADFEPSKQFDVEIEDLQGKMNSSELSLDEKKKIQNDIDDLEKRKAAIFYSFVSPVGHEQDIEAVLNHTNIAVMRNFNKMISNEFGA